MRTGQSAGQPTAQSAGQSAGQSTGWGRLPDGSRSVQSPWVWRGFLFMSLIALGLCLSFATAGLVLFAVAWAVITVGWFAVAMWLWRKHIHDDDLAWQQERRRNGRAG